MREVKFPQCWLKVLLGSDLLEKCCGDQTPRGVLRGMAGVTHASLRALVLPHHLGPVAPSQGVPQAMMLAPGQVPSQGQASPSGRNFCTEPGALSSGHGVGCRSLRSAARFSLSVGYTVGHSIGPVDRSIASQGPASVGPCRRGSPLVSAVLRDGERREEGTEGAEEALSQESGFIGLAPAHQPFAQNSVSSRLLTSLVLYGGFALLGKTICNGIGVDFLGGFDCNLQDFYMGLLFSLPPMLVVLVVNQDSIVEVCPPARALREAEEEQCVDFFLGMSPWQFVLIGAVAATSEELTFRSAIQGGLAHVLQASGRGVNESTVGIAALTGIVPSFAPCAQVFAAVLTAAITGSIFFVTSSPDDPVVISRGRSFTRDMRVRLEAWNERQTLKKIYSPLMESLVSLYLAFEWLWTGNLLCPILSHGLYYTWIVYNGLKRVEARSMAAKK